MPLISRTVGSASALAIATCVVACYSGISPSSAGRRYEAYEGKVVLHHSPPNVPIDFSERSDIVDGSDGFLVLAVEILGEQPIVPDAIEFDVSDHERPERLGLVHLLDDGTSERLATQLVIDGERSFLRAELSHFSIVALTREVDANLAFSHPVGAKPRESIAPCFQGGWVFGTYASVNGKNHAGLDYFCNDASGTPDTTMQVVALGHGKAVFNANGDLHGFGHYTAERYLLENGREVVCLSGHRNNTADVGPDALLAPGQTLGPQGNSGWSSPRGLYHVHTECKVMSPTLPSSDWAGPCFAYCNGDVFDYGYRDPRWFYQVRQPLLPEVSHDPNADGPTASFLVAGVPAYGHLRLFNPGPEISFDLYGIGGRGPDDFAEISDLFIEETTLTLHTDLSSEYVVTNDIGRLFTPGTYRFFAYVREVGQAEATSGYPVTIEVVDHPQSVVVDDQDSGASRSMGLPGQFRRGGGYFLDHLRVPNDRDEWASWAFSGSPGRYRIDAYMAEDCDGTVQYQLHDGTSSSISSDAVDQGQSGWQPLRFGGADSVDLDAGMSLRLDVLGQNAAQVCIDAVKFEALGDLPSPDACMSVADGDYCGSGSTLEGYEGNDSDLVTCMAGEVVEVVTCDNGCLEIAGEDDVCDVPPPPGCGDGSLEPPEECEGLDLGGATCQSEGFDAGSLTCRPSCTLDVGHCCLDECSSGTTNCSANTMTTCTVGPDGCTQWTNPEACQYGCLGNVCNNVGCGDGSIDTGEDCDGDDLGGANCGSLGYDGGTLACGGSCFFDESSCCYTTHDILNAQYPAYTAFGDGCSLDGGVRLKLSAEQISDSTVRFRVRKTDDTAWGSPATLRLYVGAGPECSLSPPNVEKVVQAVVVGDVTQVIDLTVDPYDAAWNDGEMKEFWVGKTESGYESARATGTIEILRSCQ